MKRQRLASSFTPALQEWLEEELENRGIDSVYARSILSLLQQDYVDVEPTECQDTRNRQLKVLYKYGGPENICYASKIKYQKWKTWGKNILTSTSPCCKAAYYDRERILKKAAIDCLKSASDYVNDIEELIDEVWVKLKAKSLKGEQEEIALRNHSPLGRSFFIPPSPTDEIEKYFAAFPPLNSKTECAVKTAQQKILKNAWCRKCNLKRKSKPQNEKALNAKNQVFHSYKSTQPIIPYRSLKTLKNIFKNSGNKYPWKASCAQGHFNKRHVTYGANCFKGTAMIRDQLLSFNNLTFVNIYGMSLNKMELLILLKGAKEQNALLFYNEPSIFQEALVVKSADTRRLNKLPPHLLQKQSSNSISLHKTTISESNLERCASGPNNSFQAFSEENSMNDAKKLSDFSGLDIHFKMSPLADLLEYESPCLEPSDDSPVILQNRFYLEAMKHYFHKMANSCDVDNFELCTYTNDVTNYLEPENPIIQKEKILHHNFNGKFVDSEMYSDSSSQSLEIKENLCSQNESFIINQCFNPLDTLETSQIETSLIFSDSDSDMHIESITSSKFENCSSDDEIYYSDEDSNAIFLSETKENLNFSEINLQQTEQNSSSNKDYEDTMGRSKLKTASMSDINQYNLILSVDSEEKAVLNRKKFTCENEMQQKLLNVSKFESDNVNLSNVPSQFKKLPFISYHQSESCDKSYVSEEEKKENYDHFPNFLDEKKPGFLIKPLSFSKPNNFDKVVTSSIEKCTERIEKKNSEINDKKWLFHWGDNHNFIARTWQKDFVLEEKKENNEQLFYGAEVSTTLCEKIRDEEDELLKGLYSVPATSNTIFGNELCTPKQNYLHSNYLNSQTESLGNHYQEKVSLYAQVPESRELDFNQVETYIPVINDSFTFDNIENQTSNIQCLSDYSVSFENNPFKAANFPCLSAFSNASEYNSSYKDYYMEGGGWSLASDSLTDYYCDNSYERSCSLSDLDFGKQNSGEYLEFFPQRRQRCTSETDDVEMARCSEASNLFKKMKQKLVHRKRPCCFFLQGTCSRSDCKFSHDLSTTTCRFWKEGSCFKGSTCPFLHGYVKENDEKNFNGNTGLRSDSPDLTFSLESEADFPSLATTKLEEPRAKSEASNIRVKGLKKKRREK